jgi:hypothetical protein
VKEYFKAAAAWPLYLSVTMAELKFDREEFLQLARSRSQNRKAAV